VIVAFAVLAGAAALVIGVKMETGARRMLVLEGIGRLKGIHWKEVAWYPRSVKRNEQGPKVFNGSGTISQSFARYSYINESEPYYACKQWVLKIGHLGSSKCCRTLIQCSILYLCNCMTSQDTQEKKNVIDRVYFSMHYTTRFRGTVGSYLQVGNP